MPRLRRCAGICVTLSPATRMRPASGSSKPAIIRSVVVLPQPEGPRSAKNSPGSIFKSMPSTARVVPSKLFSTRSRRTSAAVRGLSFIATGPNQSAAQDARHTRVDVILALVVPFPIDLDQLRDFRFCIVELRVVIGTELHLLIRWRVPHGFAQRFLYVGAQDEIDILVRQLAHLGAGRDVPDLLEREHALRGCRERDWLVLPVVTIDAAVVQHADVHLGREKRLLHA